MKNSVKSKKKNDTEEAKNESDKKQKNDELEKNNKKPLFIQRFVAYLIDFLIVALVASLISSPFINSEKIEKLSEDSTTLVEKYVNQEISVNEYTAEYMNIEYDMARTNGLMSIITVFLGVCYFVVLQLYLGGQTLGKKLMKIRVVSETGNLSMNQMIFRSFISNSILVDIISILFMIFASRTVYFYCVGLFSLIQYIIIFVSVIMVIYTKEGLSIHDRIVHTKVIKEM